MALDEKDFERINALIDQRAGDWRSEAKNAARVEARSEVKAVDERVAKRNTIFGVGVGAVILALAGGAYKTFHSTVGSVADTALRNAVSEAREAASDIAINMFEPGSKLLEVQKDLINGIVDGRTKMAGALSETEKAQKSANEAASAVEKLKNRIEMIIIDAQTSASGAEKQNAKLQTEIEDSEKLVVDLRNALEAARGATERFQAEARQFEKASAQLDEARQLLDLISDKNSPLGEVAAKIVEVAIDNEEIQRQIASAAKFPRDAVVAFGPRGEGVPICPEGWSVFDRAEGRFIIGAQEKIYDVGMTGGSAQVKLTEAQMPRHEHEVTWVGHHTISLNNSTTNVPGDNRYRLPFSRDGRAGNNMIAKSKDEAAQPHPNMPPYIALYFCKKD